ncbi:MAG TPA: tetratricopeptide repeat protein [Hyphomicrobiaceae bacterium]|nr:tetratricopeptide repeat protein [Hyphomicrobiaceae bacterium]
MERRLVAILAADAVGYSRRMGVDEEIALSSLSACRAIMDAAIESRGGRVFGSAGDSVVAEFQSSVEAVRSAIDIQNKLRERNDALPEAERLMFRIGVNFGDVMLEDGNIFGDGVNVATRLEGIALPGGICISNQVAEQIAGKFDATFTNTGSRKLKNIAKPVEVWIWPPVRTGFLRRVAIKWRQLASVAGLALVAVAIGLYTSFDFNQEGNLPTGPRIVLIPFTNLGSNPEDAFFSEGLTRDINAYLSKFSNLFVIAPAAGSVYRDNANCELIRKDLQADYILTGTVRRSLDKLRITTAFTDARTCRQLDAPGPFDRDLNLGSVLDIQLEIATKVASQIGSSDAPLFNADVQRAIRNKAPESLAAYECVLLSFWFYENFESDRHRAARTCLERAVLTDPDYSLGWSRLAFSYIESKKYAIDTPPDWAELSRKAADKAIDLDPDNPDAYYALAIMSQMLGADKAVLQNFAERAVALNPNDAFVLADLGTWIAYTGEWERGKEWVTRAKLLNPNYQSWYDWIWLLHHYLNGEFDEARDVGLKINLPNNYVIQAALTATYGMLGDQQNAEQALTHLLELRPNYPEDPRAPYRVRGMPPELIEDLMKGLRKAGLEVPPA